MRYLKGFEYFEPTTLGEAAALLKEKGGGARVLAGGTDLLVNMKSGGVAPTGLINLKTVQNPDLRAIAGDETGGIRIGSLVTLQSILDSPLVQELAPVLSDTARRMASHQVRNIATIGGNLCNGSPSADMAPPLMALGAEVKIVGPEGERVSALEDFFQGPGETALGQDEILAGISLPRIHPAARATYEKFAPREAMALAIVGVAVMLRLEKGSCEEVRIALGAVAPTPIRARGAERVLDGKVVEKRVAGEAARVASEEARPITDIRGSAAYRRALVEVLVGRAVERVAQT